MAISCITANSVTSACVLATSLGAEIHLFDEDDVEIQADDILNLSPGVHTFTIRNLGTGRLHVDEITINDPTFSVTQPVDRDLQPGDETTFTVTIP